MYPIQTEGARNAQFIISEANGYRSRDQALVAVPAGATLAAGAILMRGPQTLVGPDSEEEDAVANQAILYETLVNPGDAEVVLPATVISRDAEVTGAHLTYATGASDAAKATANAALADLGIIVR